jgi:hypothetical protein
MKILYEDINREAEQTFGDEITRETYGKWVDHWFATAEARKTKLEDEGLVETANHLQNIISEQRKAQERFK